MFLIPDWLMLVMLYTHLFINKAHTNVGKVQNVHLRMQESALPSGLLSQHILFKCPYAS